MTRHPIVEMKKNGGDEVIIYDSMRVIGKTVVSVPDSNQNRSSNYDRSKIAEVDVKRSLRWCLDGTMCCAD